MDFIDLFESLKKERATRNIKEPLFSIDAITEEDKLLELHDYEELLEKLRKKVFKMRRELGR